MGFFSWITIDTNESISNSCSCRGTFEVILCDDKGNQWIEEDYEGYGVFNGKDFYILLAEMNGHVNDDKDVLRDIGIKLWNEGDKKTFISPTLSREGVYTLEHNQTCQQQGFFYSDEESDEYSEEESDESSEEESDYECDTDDEYSMTIICDDCTYISTIKCFQNKCKNCKSFNWDFRY